MLFSGIERCPVVGINDLGAVRAGLDEAFEGKFHIFRSQLAIAAGELETFLQRELGWSCRQLLDVSRRIIFRSVEAGLNLTSPCPTARMTLTSIGPLRFAILNSSGPSTRTTTRPSAA